jgi:DNA modification methylase
MDINKIIPYERNAKKHPKKQVEQVAASIKAFGFNQPIVLDKKNVIIVGHGRYEAAKLLGLKDVPTITVNLSEEKARAYRLADNKLNESKWDMDLVIEELKLMSEEMIDMTGFDKDLIIEGNEHDDDVPAVTGAVKTKIGDVWALGDHLLACGDSTDPKSVAALLDGEKAAMCWTDPPFNMAYTGGAGKRRKGIENDKMSSEKFEEFMRSAVGNILENTEGGIYICMGPAEMPNLRRVFKETGGHWSADIIWAKNNFTLSGDDYQHTYEPILYGWSNAAKEHYFVDRRDISNVWEDLSEIKTEFDGKKTTITFHGFKIRIDGEVKGGEVVKKKQHMDIWRHNKPTISNLHPTTKPVSLVLEAIMNSSREGDIVLDLFMGSGSTIIAAEKSGRICYGMELEPHYVDVAVKRWEEFTKQKAKKI